jgi:hypothetical protein
MNPLPPLAPGDRLELKKPHPCGANCWEVVRLGMDLKLRCCDCGRHVVLPRSQVERRFKRLLTPAPSDRSPTTDADR